MNGWRLTGLLSLLLLAMTLYFLDDHADVEGLRLVIRSTARTSLILFAMAFAAGALAELAPNGFTQWQRRNRRYLGVSFAVSHAIHLAALIALAQTDAELFWALTNPTNIVLAGTAYVLLAAMAATSFDRTVAVGKRLPQGPIYWAMMALVLAVAIVRLVAMSRRSRRGRVVTA
jgi:hypothetical protein